MVHGDDFFVVAPLVSLDHLSGVLATRCSVREARCVGFSEDMQREATVLNRVIRLGFESGRKYVQLEADGRHTDLLLAQFGLERSEGRAAATLGRTLTDAEVDQRVTAPPLAASEATAFRSGLVRASFLSQDRPDLAETVKRLTHGMAAPHDGHLVDLKHPATYHMADANPRLGGLRPR